MQRSTRFLAALFALFALFAAPAAAAEITPAEDLKVVDFPYDAGGAVLLTWKAMPYDAADVTTDILISQDGKTETWKEILSFPSHTNTKADIDLPFWAWSKDKSVHAVKIEPRKAYVGDSNKGRDRIEKADYFFKVRSSKGKASAESASVIGSGKGNWFSLPRLNNLLFMLIFCGIVLWYISHARKKDLFMRRIPGLDAVDEAIGRATEMGRPIYYMTGRKDIDEIPTIAASLILGEIAKKVAEYDTELKVPHTYALTMSICQEITKQAYSTAGRPDAYKENCNFFITDDQFAYTAAVNGMMVREKPAACFYMGYYYAESLLLAEVGASVGAIQIAGTDAEHQLPFFFITCDYTLIGEELYAAGAYLSREPVLVGTLRGQDIGKAFTIVVIFLGVIVSTLGVLFGFESAAQVILEPFKSF